VLLVGATTPLPPPRAWSSALLRRRSFSFHAFSLSSLAFLLISSSRSFSSRLAIRCCFISSAWAGSKACPSTYPTDVPKARDKRSISVRLASRMACVSDGLNCLRVLVMFSACAINLTRRASTSASISSSGFLQCVSANPPTTELRGHVASKESRRTHRLQVLSVSRSMQPRFCVFVRAPKFLYQARGASWDQNPWQRGLLQYHASGDVKDFELRSHWCH
jgi:hypothetical protein